MTLSMVLVLMTVNSFCTQMIYIHIFIKCRTHSELEIRGNIILHEINMWLLGNNLVVNTAKTQALFFGTSDQSLTIRMNGELVVFVEELKCLGVVIDSRLDIAGHIDTVFKKVLICLRQLYSVNMYLPLHVKKRLAYSLLMSHVLYGIEVYSAANLRNFGKLSRVFNMILRFVYGLRKYDHVSSYSLQFLGAPFDVFVNARVLYLFYKLITSGNPPLLRSTFTFSRSTRNIQVILPQISSSIRERSFVVRVARMWNRLPLDLRTFSISPQLFKSKCTEFLLADH